MSLMVHRNAIMKVVGGGAPPAADYLLTEDGDRITDESGNPFELTGFVEGLALVTLLDGTEGFIIVQDAETRLATINQLMEYIHG
jgi:hypothetical protein